MPETTAATPLPSSIAAGRYQVKQLLGEGAVKRVYLAHDTRLDREVALSLIKTDGLDEAGRLRVRREAQAMGRLGDHPHIVTVFDTGEEAGQPIIVSAYMPGGDLEERLAASEGGRLPVAEVRRIAGQVCDALEHAHSRGVIHRDLKPGNIWIAADGAARLGDFGLAHSVDRSRLTQEGMMVGTVAYMPPEQALGRTPDARSDLYALGATLYELLTGRPPFLGDDAVATISQHINTPPVAPSWHNPEISKRLEALILALLEKDPERRPQSAREAQALLAAVEAPSAVEEAPVEGAEANPLDRLATGIFVGREEQIAVLRQGLESTLSGQGRILMLVGEPGIGKTRTAEELTTYAHLRGAQVLWGRCYEGEGAPAFWPWVQVIRTYVYDREPKDLLWEMGSGAANIAEVVSDVRERLPGLPKPPELEAEQARFRLFDSVSTFLRNASTQQPLVLILDDLHWADRPSLLLLQYLARELEGARLLVLGTYRDVEVSRQHPLEETLAELARAEASERILLRGLSRRDVARFIELTAGRPPPEALVEAVYRETEGNPFFVNEVVRLLQTDGRLEHPETVQSWSVEIPQGVRQVIGRRLNSLSEDCNRVLTLASAIGREFELRVLAGVAELSEEALLERLEQAEEARVIVESQSRPGVFRFSHALVRETLYEEIRTTRRLRLHLQIGEALERCHAAKPEPHLAELAYHFCESASLGDVEKAVSYAERAAERARASLAFEEEAGHVERALAALEVNEEAGPTRRCELLLALGRARFRAGLPERSEVAFEAALELARQTGSAEHFALAAMGEWGKGEILSPSPVTTRLQEQLPEALERLAPADSALRARVLALLSIAVYWDAPEQCRELGEQAVAMARRVKDPRALFEALIQLSWTYEGTGEIEKAIAIGRELVELGQQLGDKAAEFWGRARLLASLSATSAYDEIEREIETFSAQAEELREPRARAYRAWVLATRALREGRLAEARSLVWEGLKQATRFEGTQALSVFGVQHFLLRRLQGRFGEVTTPLRQELARFPSSLTGIFRAELACALAETGQAEEALAELDALAEGDFATLQQVAGIPYALAILLAADACFAAGHNTLANPLHRFLLPWRERCVCAGIAAPLGAADRGLGNLAAMQGRFDEAMAHFEKAIEIETRMHARGLLPRAQRDYASALLDRDEPGDREQALALLDEAIATCQELGLKGWLDMCLETRLRAQGVDSGSLDIKGTIDAIAASLGSHPPDLSEHASHDGTVTLMFSDMEGFTAMTERLGDQRAHQVISEHNAIVRETLARHEGRELELQGDGFLLCFASATNAFRCAVALQRAFASYSARHPEEPIRVRIGLHTGQAIRDRDRFFGLTVILAARIAAQARGGEILVSEAVRERVEQSESVPLGEGRQVALKGISEPQRLFPVEWQEPGEGL